MKLQLTIPVDVKSLEDIHELLSLFISRVYTHVVGEVGEHSLLQLLFNLFEI